jgi:hypothetical protein
MIVNERVVAYINSLDCGNSDICNTIEKEAIADEVPIIRKEMGNLLKVLLQLVQPESILEVGTAVGYSSILMSENMPEKCTITTIENYGFEFITFKGDIEFLNDGDSVFLDEDELKILFVPGHSPGSIAFYNENQKFVISGDALFQGSIGRTDLYRGNHSQLLESIKNKLFTLPEETEVYSGHGKPTQIGFEKNHNPFF